MADIQEHSQYDIIVVGGGPAGGAAAQAAAEKGAKVVLLEEHPAIGLPRHCAGLLPDSEYTPEILKVVGKDVLLQKVGIRRVFAPSGRLVQEITLGNRYAVRREEFDKAWVRLAANAGVDIVLNTRVVSIMRENGRIAGVSTNSREIPDIRGKLVIVASGFCALRTGISKQEGLTWPDESFYSGLQLELTNVRGVESGVSEIHLWSISGRRVTYIEPCGKNTWMVNFRSIKEFEETKRETHVLSKKLKDAVPLRILGYVVPTYYGHVLPKTVKDGLILAGSAAGFNGMIAAVITGKRAGEVAAEAIQKGNVSEAELSNYETIWRGTWLEHMYDSWRELMRTFHQLRDESLEKFLKEKAEERIALSPDFWFAKSVKLV